MHAAATSVRCIYIQILQAFVWSNFIFPLQNQECFVLVVDAQQLPWVLKQAPRAFPAGTESRLRIHSESRAKGRSIMYFSGFSCPQLFTSGGEKGRSPFQVATRGWSVCLLTETTPRQPWARLQTDRLQQSTHQLINLCQNSFVKHLPTTSVFWNTLQQDKKAESLA